MEILHEEQERVVKIEAIKKSLEIEVKNLSVRLEEVEANAIVGGKRIISKLEARIRDFEAELDEEKRRHAETIKILRKKERTVKEVMIQCEEDQKNIALLQESLDKANHKISLFKRQLQEVVSSRDSRLIYFGKTIPLERWKPFLKNYIVFKNPVVLPTFQNNQLT